MRLPLIILAGGAKESEFVPARPGLHRLAGPKGATLRVGGRPLIDEVVERFHRSEFFEPIFVAGPAGSYGAACGPAEVIDTDADFGANVKRALETVVARLSPPALTFSTCDVIPQPDELDRLMADYRQHAPLDFWYPLIAAPEERAALGASSYKRQYRVRPEGQQESIRVLPGHLAAVAPSAPRLRLIYRTLELAYRSRTRRVFRRFVYITSNTLLWLLTQDLKAPFKLQPPLLTFEVVYNAIMLSVRLGKGTITQRQLESHLRRMFVHRRHRSRYKRRRGRLPVLDALSLAKDIDTEHEAAERSLEISQEPSS